MMNWSIFLALILYFLNYACEHCAAHLYFLPFLSLPFILIGIIEFEKLQKLKCISQSTEARQAI